MMALKTRRLAPLALAVLAATAQAQDNSMFSFSGFATLGLVGMNTDDAQYATFGQVRGADKSWSGEVDSKLGLQATAKFSPMFSATVQLLSKQNGDGNFNPGLEWAFLKAQLSPGLSVRLGRMGGPFFAVSDFRDVGYANTWVRPPLDVYSQVPFSSFDGADLNFQTSTPLGTWSAQVFGGQSKTVIAGTDVDLKKAMGFNTTLEMDNGLSLRFGHVAGKLTAHTTTLAALVATIRLTPFTSTANELDPTDKKAAFTGLGLNWDNGSWLVSAEYTQRRTDSYASDTNAWFVTVGHRIDKFTPYVTVSQIKNVDSNINNTIQPLTPGLAQLKAAVDGFVATQVRTQKTWALGVRWDFMRNTALKAQFDRIKPTGPGFFINTQPGFGTGNSVNVYSIAVDTVF